MQYSSENYRAGSSKTWHGYVGILHERSDVFVSSTVIVLLYSEWDIYKNHAVVLQEAREDIRKLRFWGKLTLPGYFIKEVKLTKCFPPLKGCFNPQVLMNFLPVERQAAPEIDEPRAPRIDLKPLQSAAALPRVAFWSAFCQICWGS